MTKFFVKKESHHQLGISLRQDALVFCYFPENAAPRGKEIPVLDNNYQLGLMKLADDGSLKGECHLVLSPQFYQVVQLDKPQVPPEEINAALKWQVKDLVTFPPEDMVLDYFDTPRLPNAQEKVNVVCARQSVLKEMVTLLQDKRLKLKSIITEEFAFSALLPPEEEASLLVCQQPHEEIVLLIVKQGQLYFHRRLRGFSHIAQRSELELQAGVIDALSLEIQRSSDFFERQLKQAPIKNIRLMLPMSLEMFLAEKLSENTNVPVTLLELEDTVPREISAARGAILADRRGVA
ncbi:MSHA biogenesis protein MshI [Thalassomonas viridans]|uniref:MSHA biogenesis protein MshI n=1 Tax=Thalassomonas viridans TaxID=137584 RepID=A0AAE9Z1H2_9GAMM|nr:MSHA biogenesis protein MshI [Thalassomonas viridans]WDE04507.1 MSHA biogenesis protein MshI [Thalassomonas viridans]